MKPFRLIVAIDSKHGIGKDGGLPWHLPGDLKHFKKLSTQTDAPHKQNAVIMGRKTWDSIPEKFRPLPNRINLVLSQNPKLDLPSGVLRCDAFEKALTLLNDDLYLEKIDHIFVIGGAHVFEAALQHPACETLHVTHIEKSFACDTFFPDFEKRFEPKIASDTFQENGISYYFCEYERRIR